MKYLFIAIFMSATQIYGVDFDIDSRVIYLGDGTGTLTMNESKKVVFNVSHNGGLAQSMVGKFRLSPPSCLADYVSITNVTGWQTIPVSTAPVSVEFVIHLFNLPNADYCDANLSTVCSNFQQFDFTLDLLVDHDADPQTPFFSYPCDQSGSELEFMRSPGGAIVLKDKLAEFHGPIALSALDSLQALTQVYAQSVEPDDRFFIYMDWNASPFTGSPWENVYFFRFPISQTCRVTLSASESGVDRYNGDVYRYNASTLEPIIQDQWGGAGGLNDFGAGVNIFEVTDLALLGCSGTLANAIDYSSPGTYSIVYLNSFGFTLRDVILYTGEEMACEAEPDSVFLGTKPEFFQSKLALNVIDQANGMTLIKCEFLPSSALLTEEQLKPGLSIDWRLEDASGHTVSYIAQASTAEGVTIYDGFSIPTSQTGNITVSAVMKHEDGENLLGMALLEASYQPPFTFGTWDLTEEFVNEEPDDFFDPGEIIEVPFSVAGGGSFYHGYAGQLDGEARLVLRSANGHHVFSMQTFAGISDSAGYVGDLEADSTLIEKPYVNLVEDSSFIFELLKASEIGTQSDPSDVLKFLFGFEKTDGSDLVLLYRKETYPKAVFNPLAESFLDHDFTYIEQVTSFSGLTRKHSSTDPEVDPGSTPVIVTDPDPQYGWRWNSSFQQFDCRLSPLDPNRTSNPIPVHYLYSNEITHRNTLTISIEQHREFYSNWNYGGALEYRVKTGSSYSDWIHINRDPVTMDNFNYNSFPFYDQGYAGPTDCLLSTYEEHAWTEASNFGDDDPITKAVVRFPAGDKLEFRIFAENPDETYIPAGFNWAIKSWNILYKDTIPDNYFQIVSQTIACGEEYIQFGQLSTWNTIVWYQSLEEIMNNGSGVQTSPQNRIPLGFTGSFYAKVYENPPGTAVRYIEIKRIESQMNYGDFLLMASYWRDMEEPTGLLELVSVIGTICN